MILVFAERTSIRARMKNGLRIHGPQTALCFRLSYNLKSNFRVQHESVQRYRVLQIHIVVLLNGVNEVFICDHVEPGIDTVSNAYSYAIRT